uniref:Uncharacterized protein n=1 Tax=Romanomermis culicivorax TaxID=13658 RepID=A0A915I9Y0_ROMCU
MKAIGLQNYHFKEESTSTSLKRYKSIENWTEENGRKFNSRRNMLTNPITAEMDEWPILLSTACGV